MTRWIKILLISGIILVLGGIAQNELALEVTSVDALLDISAGICYLLGNLSLITAAGITLRRRPKSYGLLVTGIACLVASATLDIGIGYWTELALVLLGVNAIVIGTLVRLGIIEE